MFFNKDEKIKGAGARKTFHWKDEHKGDNVLYRIPRNIKWNDNIIVREDEAAVFFRDGKVMKVFDKAGRYAITTQNIPVLAKIAAKTTGIKQLGEVYYIQRKVLRGKFGTLEPLTFRDRDFGLIRIRCFGRFSYKVKDPVLFINEFVGTKGISSSEEVKKWNKSQIIMCINDVLGELKKEKNMAVVDMPAYLQEIEQMVLSKANPTLKNYGLKVMKIIGINLNFPEEVERAIDKSGAMRTVNANYSQYQTGKAVENIGKGAEKGGGNASNMSSMGAGMGAGLGMAKEMSSGMSKPTSEDTTDCPKCGYETREDSKFCQNCGEKLHDDTIDCPNCDAEVGPNAKFCYECGTKLKVSEINCPKCDNKVSSKAKFCPECGTDLEN